jgi:hypothetical protein
MRSAEIGVNCKADSAGGRKGGQLIAESFVTAVSPGDWLCALPVLPTLVKTT